MYWRAYRKKNLWEMFYGRKLIGGEGWWTFDPIWRTPGEVVKLTWVLQLMKQWYFEPPHPHPYPLAVPLLYFCCTAIHLPRCNHILPYPCLMGYNSQAIQISSLLGRISKGSAVAESFTSGVGRVLEAYLRALEIIPVAYFLKNVFNWFFII